MKIELTQEQINILINLVKQARVTLDEIHIISELLNVLQSKESEK